jgi:hypothetical protein
MPGSGFGSGTALRVLSNDLRDASDSTILRVTRVIDTLAERGEADRLLESLRPRLMELRPPRPRMLARVLFMPLQPVIVTPGEWRPGSAAVPRSVIAPITALVRSRLPGLAAIDASLAAGDEPDGKLWQDAASILADGPMPLEWSLPAFQAIIGIKPQALPPLLGAIRLVFAHAAVLRTDQEPGWETVQPLLLEAARSGPLSWSIVLALLFEKTANPLILVERVLALARETGIARQLETSLQSVIGTVVDRLDRPAPEQALSDDALDAQATRASRLVGFGALRGDMQAFAGRLTQRRRQMAAQCSAQLAIGLSNATAACVPTGRLEPQDEQEAAERLEARLRSLRRLDLASRPLGDALGRGAQSRDQLLAESAAFYTGAAAPSWLTQADRLRLCEILVGAEAALRLIEPDPVAR